MAPILQLIYHPGIPGRAEPIRLFLEATRTSYEDSTRSKDADSAVAQYVQDGFPGSETNFVPFAVPALVVKDVPEDKDPLVISQTSNILLYLASSGHVGPVDLGEKEKRGNSTTPTPRLDKGSAVDHRLHAIMLTISDFLSEIHDTHHPISVVDYYENQKDAALARAAAFRTTRVPKFLNHFETNLRKAGTAFLSGSASVPSYVDLSLFHAVDGLEFAFPNMMRKIRDKEEFPRLMALHDRLKAAPVIAEYLQSDRRWTFNEYGLFRPYPELDDKEET